MTHDFFVSQLLFTPHTQSYPPFLFQYWSLTLWLLKEELRGRVTCLWLLVICSRWLSWVGYQIITLMMIKNYLHPDKSCHAKPVASYYWLYTIIIPFYQWNQTMADLTIHVHLPIIIILPYPGVMLVWVVGHWNGSLSLYILSNEEIGG